jgi:urease gamma subunit
MIVVAADLARRRKERGLKLNYPEAANQTQVIEEFFKKVQDIIRMDLFQKKSLFLRKY